ncbi:MAG: hypothetical protein E7019_00975 [Alphaproteobacteria bacterium]|nr:hypothetical protein [Alphaproteobacteria bacterium]
MNNKIFSGIFLSATILTLCGCQYIQKNSIFSAFSSPAPEEQAAQNIDPQPIRSPSSIVVCRSHQCAPAKLSMSTEYIYNSLLQLFDNNNYNRALLCQADPSAHTCLENYITIPLMAGITPTNAYIDYVKITDVIVGKKANSINLILNYNITYGGQAADCTPSQSLLFARNINHVIMEDAGYSCKMTTIGQSSVKTLFAIDYIDLDYGYIGGRYSIGISGPAYGGSNGYMMLRMPKNAYPLSPQLKAPTKTSRKGANPYGANIKTTLSTDSTTGNNISDTVQVFPIKK